MPDFIQPEKKSSVILWKEHKIRQYNGPYEQIELNAEKQVPSINCGYSDYLAPIMVYMPDKDRLLIVTHVNDLVNPIYRTIHTEEPLTPVWQKRVEDATFIMISDDHGKSWRYGIPFTDDTGFPILNEHCADIVYLGKGVLLLIASALYENTALAPSSQKSPYVFRSEDWGDTWKLEDYLFPNKIEKGVFYGWGSLYIDPLYSTDTSRIMIHSGYSPNSFTKSNSSGLRYSFDDGKTWTNIVFPSNWQGANEVKIIRAQNGDLVAAIRYWDTSTPYTAWGIDHYCGLKTSYSTDNGQKWSEPQILFDFGRHQPTMVNMPNGDIVMTYIVRAGYPRDEYDHIQAGMEAVVSHDFGRTWDLDHRYILDDWAGNSKRRPVEFLNAGQNASTVLLPDMSLLTVCTSGVNSQPEKNKTFDFHEHQFNELHLVHWRLNEGSVNNCHEISDSAPHSDLRNKLCNHASPDRNLSAWMKHNRNIALADLGVTVHGSDADQDLSIMLDDRCSRRTVKFNTCPAWFELSFPEEKMINGVVLYPGSSLVDWGSGLDMIPTEYTIRYAGENGEWFLLAKSKDDIKCVNSPPFFVSPEDYLHKYEFAPVKIKKLRIDITKTTDPGFANHLPASVLLPMNKRRTAIRMIEVLEFRE